MIKKEKKISTIKIVMKCKQNIMCQFLSYYLYMHLLCVLVRNNSYNTKENFALRLFFWFKFWFWSYIVSLGGGKGLGPGIWK